MSRPSHRLQYMQTYVFYNQITQPVSINEPTMHLNINSSWICFLRGPEDNLVKVKKMSPWQYTIFIVYKIKCSVIDWQVVFICYNTLGWKAITKKKLRYNAVLNSRYCPACRGIVVSTSATSNSRSRLLGLLWHRELCCENLKFSILLYIPWYIN